MHDLQPGIFKLRDKFTRKKEPVRGQTGGKAQLTTVANDFDNIGVHERLASDKRNAHGAKLANFAYPFFQVLQIRMRSAVVVLSAIGAIEVATVRHVKTALQRSAIEETLAGFQNVIAGKFAADFVEELHAV